MMLMEMQIFWKRKKKNQIYHWTSSIYEKKLYYILNKRLQL